MPEMTIIDVVVKVYPDEFEKGNVAFGQTTDGPIFITEWAVPNTTKPNEEDLVALIPSLQEEFDLAYAAKQQKEEFLRVNAHILACLNEIDRKSIRAIREGDQERIDELEAEAVALRAQLQ